MSYMSHSSLAKNFSRITISIASPDSILSRSYGEVTKPETINYRSFKPEKDGLFCEKIFGPIKDWECHCGKYKRIRYKGIICDRCGVEVTLKAVRRERMGHIALAVPVVHIWYVRSLPSKIGSLLGMTIKQLEKVIYYESYVVIQAGKAASKEVKTTELLSEEEVYEIKSELGPENDKLSNDHPEKFIAMIGGDAVKELLRRVNVEPKVRELRVTVKTETSIQKRLDILKQLRVAEAFRTKGPIVNRPEWMVLDIVPVIPPELRPLVPLEGGRFATSDLNDLYRRVIIRNNRLKKLLEIKAPEVILRNEKRMLQEAVDSLFDNSRRTAAVRSDSNRALKSLSDMLKGKQGRFRQNLLGKRVDYSGRSVIVVGPELRIHECGLPKDMAVELFKPFIIRKLVEKGFVKTVKSAKKVVDKKGQEVWDILERIVSDHPVLLNRAPTLHRLGIQAFQPILIEGKAIQIHPLVCAAFNADFDGDQMAVHVPLSFEAQVETRLLMLSSHNVLSPANGRPMAIPSQDIVLGNYYLTKAKDGDKGEGKLFSSPDEVIIAYDAGKVGLHAKIKVRIQDDGESKMIETTTGRIIFNKVIPEGVGFLNELLTKKTMEELVSNCMRKVGNLPTVTLLDQLKEVGFQYAMRSGSSISLADVVTPPDKEKIITEASKRVERIEKAYHSGHMTDGEKYNKVIDIWTRATNDVAGRMYDTLKDDQTGFNSIFMMMDSGARGSKDQVKQLGGMRGLMAKPQKSMTGQTGEIIENPITANFKEGLSVLEYFISTHGARKGLADTALKTADAGYLTRRLVDVAQDVIITQEDCGTFRGIEISAIKEGEDVIEPLSDRILGRVTVDDVYDPISEDLIVEAAESIDEEMAQEIEDLGVETVMIRSVLTCEAKRGVCARCYGRNLANGDLVGMGEAVGVMAAQSIGEPGTQLTLRTFHIGGTAARIAAQSQATSKAKGKVVFAGNLKFIDTVDESGNDIVISLGRNSRIELKDDNNRIVAKHTIPYGAQVLVKADEQVEKNQIVFVWDPYSSSIITEYGGTTRFVDIEEGLTFREEADETTGKKQPVIIESKNKNMNPHIEVVDKKGKVLSNYILPTRANLVVKNKQKVRGGDVLAKIPRSIISKTRDITGGLPRVAELFEARKPKEPAIVSEIDGYVKVGGIKRGVREILVEGRDETRTYKVPFGKHILVHEGDFVEAGDQISDGSIVPHDILRIKGPNKVQEYLVNEIQEVYRLQGVKINDKHIEIIVRQMLQRVKIADPGDTVYLPDDYVDRVSFLEENARMKSVVVVTDPGETELQEMDVIPKTELDRINAKHKKDKQKPAKSRKAEPAHAEPLLLGITQSSLSTQSFVSAASFQETTKVLTDASVECKTDELLGLKENVIMGRLIPAGTGISKYQKILVTSNESEDGEEEVVKRKSKKKASA